MVVQKIVVQRTYKFTANCSFELPVNQAVTDVNTLIRSMQTDMNNAEKGGQWLLTCYAPFKEKPVFPGFDDLSFEEVRLGFYEATKSGTVDVYKQQLQGLLQAAMQKVRALQNPSADLVNILKEIYNIPVAGSFQNGTNNNVFGGPQLDNKGFGACPPYSSPSGGSPASNAPFGGIVQQNQFGAQSGQFDAQSRPFGATAHSNTPFGGAAAATGAIVPFGGMVAQGANAPFGAAPSTSGNISFGQTASSPFGAQIASPFGAVQNAANNSPFGDLQDTTSSPFGAQVANLFGGQAATGNTPFGAMLNACYAPFKEKPMFPDDMGFEEIKMGFYIATKSRTKRQMKGFFQATMQKVQTPVARSFQSSSNVNSSSNVFGGAQQENKDFGVKQDNAVSLFGSPQSANLFGAPQQSQFGMVAANSLFGVQQPVATSNNLFGATQQPIATSNSLFSPVHQQVATNNNVFGAVQQPVSSNNNMFGAVAPDFLPNNRPAHTCTHTHCD